LYRNFADLCGLGLLGLLAASFVRVDPRLAMLRQVDQRIGLSKGVTPVLHAPREPDRISHSIAQGL